MFCAQISLNTFNNIAEICRIVRKSSAACDGMQYILSGDFYKLPPVPDMGHGDSGEFLFSSTFLKTPSYQFEKCEEKKMRKIHTFGRRSSDR